MTAAKRALFSFTPFPHPSGVPSIVTFVIDASTDKVGWVFQVDESEAITHGGFNLTDKTGSANFRISLQSVNASGDPSGTVLGGGTPASKSFANADVSVGWNWLAFDNSYTPAVGDFLALVIEDDTSGTNPDASNNITVGYCINNVWTCGLPKAAKNTGSWTDETVRFPTFGVKSATRTYGSPFDSVTEKAASTSGHRIAQRILLPAGFGSTFTVAGLRFHASRLTVGGGTCLIGLWNSGGALETIALDTDFLATNNQNGHHDIYFDTPAQVNFGDEIYAGIEHNGTVCGMYTFGVPANTDLSALPLGDAIYYASFNGTSWSADDTERPMIDLILSDITEPAGGGGGIVKLAGNGGGLAG